MKLLGWMRGKIKQSNTEPFKEFITGNYSCLSVHSSLDDADIYPNSCSVNKRNRRSLNQPNKLNESHSPEMKFDGAEDEFRDETAYSQGEFFNGFLAIGTLGAETLVSEPATPTFGLSEENITEGKEAVTENDLTYINYKLEKFIEAEAEECNGSPVRSSRVSTITPNGKQMEGTTVRPLQGYLFGSSIELPETNIEVEKVKGSLAELLKRLKVEGMNKTCRKTEMQGNKKHKNSKDLIKKIFHKSDASSRGSDPSKGDSVPKKKVFKKVLQMLRRKVHPENLITEETDQVGIKLNTALTKGDLYDNQKSKKPFLALNPNNQTLGHDTKWPQQETVDTSLSGKREQWITTDAEYLVLEL